MAVVWGAHEVASGSAAHAADREPSGPLTATVVVLTHTLADPYNGDHPAAGQMALRARVLAQAVGYPAPGEPIGAHLDALASANVYLGAAPIVEALAQGADIARVHDVKQMARVARMADAVVRGWSEAQS